jgi:hypothetical protein
MDGSFNLNQKVSGNAVPTNSKGWALYVRYSSDTLRVVEK